MTYKGMLKNNKGTMIVLYAAALTLILGVCAIVADIGLVMVEKQHFQNAVDAASLAAAQELPDANLARNVANDYIVLNGYTPDDITITFENSNRTINIAGSKTVNYYFARIFGLNNTTVTPVAAASSGNVGGAFNYTLFSGSTTTQLSLNGSDMYIDGSAHTNRNLVVNGSKFTITGACEAVTTITINGSKMDINNRLPHSPFVPMPDFSETIKQQAQEAGQMRSGSVSFNGSRTNVDSPIYIDGSLSVNGSNFSGQGCILATGSIYFNGSNLTESTDDSICFYSQNGDIVVNGSNATFCGTLYAPNGRIIMNGSNQTVNGRVIADQVIYNGSNLRINGESEEVLSFLPSSGVRLVR